MAKIMILPALEKKLFDLVLYCMTKNILDL